MAVPLTDGVITIKLDGAILDKSSVTSALGFYQSTNNTITWDKNSQGKLAEINPGDSGSVNFSLSPLSLFSAQGGILLEPTINIDVSISAKQPLQGNQINKLDNSESKIIKVISLTASLYQQKKTKKMIP